MQLDNIERMLKEERITRNQAYRMLVDYYHSKYPWWQPEHIIGKADATFADWTS
jgi:hypothetical protein